MPDYTIPAFDILNEEDGKRFVGESVKADSDLLRLLIMATTDRIEEYCGRFIVPRARTEYLDGNSAVEIGLSRFPVDVLTSVEFLADDGKGDKRVDGTDGTGDVWLRKALGELKLKPGQGAFPRGTRNVKVIYNPGFNPVPHSIKAAAGMLLNKWRRDQENNREDVTSVSVEGQSISYAREKMPVKVAGILEPHRVFGLGGAA